MKAAAFEYVKSQSVLEAINAIVATDGCGKFCSGTQSLGPMLNLRLVQVEQLIDVSIIESLQGFTLSHDALQIGAAVTHAQIEDGLVPNVTHGLLAKVAAGIAYRAIRNRGTLGGSLAHADPAADWVSTMTLLDANFVIQGPGGLRHVPAADFFEGPFTTQLQFNELIVAVFIRHFGPQARWAYRKICRKPGEFAEALAAIWIDPEIDLARLVLRGLDRMPLVVQGRDHVDALRDPQLVDQTLATMGIDDAYECQLLKAMLRRAFVDLDKFSL